MSNFVYNKLKEAELNEINTNEYLSKINLKNITQYENEIKLNALKTPKSKVHSNTCNNIEEINSFSPELKNKLLKSKKLTNNQDLTNIIKKKKRNKYYSEKENQFKAKIKKDDQHYQPSMLIKRKIEEI